MSSLYELSHSAAELYARISESEDGELDSETLLLLDRVEADVPRKLESIVKVIKRLARDEARDRAEGDLVVKEGQAILKRAKVLENKQARLEKYVIACVRLIGPVATECFRKIAVQANGGNPSIKWTGEGEPPEGFRKTTVALDWDKALEHYKAGTLPEGFVVERGSHLRIT